MSSKTSTQITEWRPRPAEQTDLHRAVVTSAARGFDQAYEWFQSRLASISFRSPDYLISMWTSVIGDTTKVDNPSCGFNGEAAHSAFADALRRIEPPTATDPDRSLCIELRRRCEGMSTSRAFLKDLVIFDQTTYSSSYDGKSAGKAPESLETTLQSPTRLLTTHGARLLLPVLEQYRDTVGWMLSYYEAQCADQTRLHPFMFDREMAAPVSVVVDGRWREESQSRRAELLKLPGEFDMMMSDLTKHSKQFRGDDREMGTKLGAFVEVAANAQWFMEVRNYWLSIAEMRVHFGDRAKADWD